MILVDTTVWIDHLRGRGSALARLLERGAVLGHPWVTCELALGHLRGAPRSSDCSASSRRRRSRRRRSCWRSSSATSSSASASATLNAQLLAATRLTDDALLCTRDRRLRAGAERVGAAYTTRMG